jgi:hypothetical protein
MKKPSQGTETSKYLDERKSKRDSPSSGERTGTSLNPRTKVCGGRGVCDVGLRGLAERTGKAGHRG